MANTPIGDEIDRLRAALRSIELTVDGLNTRGFTQKPTTQAALDRIKSHCRAALSSPSDGGPA